MKTAQPAIAGFRRQRVTALRPEGSSTACLLADGGSVLISPYVAGFMAAGDEIEYTVCAPADGTEISVCRQSGGRSRELYLAPIGYVTQPKQDKRQETFLRADVANADGLGVRYINLTAAAVRDPFLSSRPQPQLVREFHVLRASQGARDGRPRRSPARLQSPAT